MATHASKDELKELRSQHNMTQAEMAKLVSVSRETFNGWECGRLPIPARKMGFLKKNLAAKEEDSLLTRVEKHLAQTAALIKEIQHAHQ